MSIRTPGLSRRAVLAGAATLPLAGAFSTPGFAAAPMLGAKTALFNRVGLGEFEVTTILASTRRVRNPRSVFGTNVSEEAFAAVSAAARIPTDVAQLSFTPTVVNTGAELILFDTGWTAAGTTAALAEAGYTPEQIDVVVLTHMHPDHIGGLMVDGAPTYANARYVTGATEFESWDMSGNKVFEAQMRPLADQTTFNTGGDAVASGITAVEAFGHTPGHMTYMLESGGKQLLLGGDFANHYIWSMANPDWQLLFDRDKEMAARTRRRILDMLVADDMPVIGYHMPWPGIGYIETRGEGFRYVAHSYQLNL